MESTRIQKFAVVAPILCIIILATVSHFQIHFEDALTQMPATEYGVNIPVWRIIFEPILGPLLFFNRSIYALQEIPLALLWALLIFIVFSSIRIFKDRARSKKIVLNMLANVPLFLGICFAIFVLILFIPLPNNTIINNSANSILVTTHAHTEFSHDGLISQEGMLKWHGKNGFDAFFITDHANHKKSLQFAQEQRRRNLPIDPLIMVGEEYSGSNHMSLLGLNGKFETKGLSDRAVVDSVHRYGGAVIINHWFDGKGKEKEFYNNLGADGFEIENVGTELYYDREVFAQLRKFCEVNHLTMIGGLDFHGYGRVCALYNAFEIPDWKTMDPDSKEQAILQILKNGPQKKLKVLMYKDRPFYSDANFLFTPFLTTINYFRTLNFFQVFSWVFWLSLFQFIRNRKKSVSLNMDKVVVLLATGSALFLIFLALMYYVRGEAVRGFSKVYSEYAVILGIIGLILLFYAFARLYFRFFKPKKIIPQS